MLNWLAVISWQIFSTVSLLVTSHEYGKHRILLSVCLLLLILLFFFLRYRINTLKTAVN